VGWPKLRRLYGTMGTRILERKHKPKFFQDPSLGGHIIGGKGPKGLGLCGGTSSHGTNWLGEV